MNTKIIIIFEIVVCVLATILVSTLGIMADSWRRDIYAKEICFVDNGDNLMVVVMYDQNNQITTDPQKSAREEKKVTLSEGVKTYQLAWTITPSDTTNKEVTFEENLKDGTVSISESGLVTFTRGSGSVIITIRTTDASELFDTITITLTPNGYRPPIIV